MIRKPILPALAAAVVLTVTGCGSGSHHHHAALPAAQCGRATAVFGQIRAAVAPFTGVKTAGDLITADMKVASNNSATGSAASETAALTAAAVGAPGSLARLLRQAGADLAAFDAASSTTPADPQTVASAARYTMADLAAITSACRR